MSNTQIISDTKTVDQEFETEKYLKLAECINALKQELDRVDNTVSELTKHDGNCQIIAMPEADLANIKFLTPEERSTILTLHKNIGKLLAAGLNASGSETKNKIYSLVQNAASRYKLRMISDFLMKSEIEFLRNNDYQIWKKWLEKSYVQCKQYPGFYFSNGIDIHTILELKNIGYDHENRYKKAYKLVPPEAILDLIIEANKIFENLEIRTMSAPNGEQALFGLYSGQVYLLARWIELDPNNAINLIKSDQRLLPFEKIKKMVEQYQLTGMSQKLFRIEPRYSSKVGFFKRLQQYLLPM